jgi:hypothetical protein
MKNNIQNPIRSVIAFFNAHHEAEGAIIKLQENGFDMTRFSIVALDLYTSEKVLGFYNAGDTMKKWALSGGFWAGFWGLLFGFSTYSIPIIGPVLIQGWIGALIAAVVLGIFGAVVGAVCSLIYEALIPRHKKIKYKTAVKAGRYMLLAQANEQEMERAFEILQLHAPKKSHHAKDWRLADSESQVK